MVKEDEPKSFKENLKRWGIVGAIVGGVIYLVSSSGLALAVGVGGGAIYVGVKYLEGKGK